MNQNEVKAANDSPPAPVPKPPTPAPKAPPQPKRDLIAEALKKEEAKKPDTKQADAKTPIPPRKPPPPAVPAFDANQVMALLDKRAATPGGDRRNDQRHELTRLGAPSAMAAILSQGELDALRARLGAIVEPARGRRRGRG